MRMQQYEIKEAKRYTERKIKNRFGNDLGREIAELITNSVDSYERLVTAGAMDKDDPKRIRIRLSKPIRKNKEKHVIEVIDNAEGMSREQLHFIFTQRGGNVNRGADNKKVRGVFGLGAHDVMAASCCEGKTAQFISFKDDEVTKLKWQYRDDKSDVILEVIDLVKDKAKIALREKYGIQSNGTVVMFGVPDSVEYPTDIDTLKNMIENVFLLWKILQRQDIQVLLEAFAEKRRLTTERFAIASLPELCHRSIHFVHKRRNFNGEIHFFENEDKTAKPIHILVMDDRDNIYDNQMFGYGKTQFNEKISGILVLHEFWEILNDFTNKGWELIKDDRSGIDVTTTFGKRFVDALKEAMEAVQAVLAAKNDVQNISLHKTRHYRSFLDYLNKDLSSNPITITERQNQLPPAEGIAFVRDSISITAGRQYCLRILVDPSFAEVGDVIEIMSSPSSAQTDLFHTERIEIKPKQMNENVIIVSCLIKGGTPTAETIELTASLRDKSASCHVNVIEERIIFPQDGLQFEREDVTWAPGISHPRIRLYFDRDVIDPADLITITSDAGDKLQCDQKEFDTSKGIMVSDVIGYVNVAFRGGTLHDRYVATARSGRHESSLSITIEPAAKRSESMRLEIQDYVFDPSGDQIRYRSYYDLTCRVVKIVKGNPINDKFIKKYDEELSGQPLLYVISLVCFEAAKIYAAREESYGRLEATNIVERSLSLIEDKTQQYFAKYLSLDAQ